jgi:cytoskeletal protein CcmA (bactofilin family)
LEAEVFLAKGSFTIGGLLNAGQIDIILYGGCRAKEIGGEKITVKKPGIAHKLKRLIFSYIFRVNVDLQADVIEGDEIYLEHTYAKIVRGNNVTIGPGCDIEVVEYKNNFHEQKGAIVKDKIKM